LDGMTDEVIPADLRDFILKYLESVAHLETLLLMQASPDVLWDSVETAKRLYCPEQQARAVLERLCADGLLTRQDSAYRYGEPEPAMAEMIRRLRSAYKMHLIPVTNLIHNKPLRVHQFADAFKLKRDR
jgi:hypothetical protein